MRKTILFYLGIIFLCVSLHGCGRTSGEDNVVIASISEDKITVGDFNERISNLPERYRDIVKRRKEEYLQELINDTLLYQEALRQGIQREREVRKVLEEARKKILVARLISDEIDDAIEVTDDEISAFYNDNPARYMTPEILRVSHILVPTREEAEDVVLEIARGEKFEDLARARSVDPTAQRGGDIGYFPKGQLMPEFDNACALLDIGQTSGPVKTSLGYHVIMLTDRRPPQQRPIEQVSDDITARVWERKRQEAFNKYLDDLRERTRIKVNEKALADGDN
jgi:peptidyl-prolyl cis-trans isomerase C